MATIQITLNREGVAAPVQRAAMICTDVVAAALTAFAEDTLTKPSMPNQFVQVQVRGPEITSDERRHMYERWLLMKGFQDLARGVRGSLEEAALYLAIISDPPKRMPTSSTLNDLFEPMRKRISSLTFPQLIRKVNQQLESEVQFEREFLSIQKARNCLEHRDGVVARQDLDDGGSVLTLSFPGMKFFYLRGEEEIELARDHRVDDGSEGPEVDILMRIVTRVRSYPLGERLTVTAKDFSEIAMACSLFGSRLAAALPLT